MPVDLKSAVSKSITELRRTISNKTSELAVLKKELRRYETALKVLRGDNRERAVRRRKVQRNGKTDWDSLFKRLPDTFTSEDFRRAAGSNKSAVYLRQILSTRTKQRKLKRVERGKYRKV